MGSIEKAMYDVIVVGAGWYGLAAAKAYLENHPSEKITVIEAEATAGGTWSRDRLYPGLKSNNLWGSYEYPDYPMDTATYGVSEGQHIPAAVLHRYLTDFAKKFGVFERIQFNTKVSSIEAQSDDTWIITTTPSKGDGGSEQKLPTKKLIMATGLTSEPNLPQYPGQETFTPPFFHAKDFCSRAETVDTCPRAVVIGGGKSALDCAYAFATAANSKTVDLVIRPIGEGPLWISMPYVTPFKRKMEELLSTRALTWFSPAPWGSEDGYGIVRSFLHGSGIGNFIVGNFWNILKADVVGAVGYNDHPELFKLKPWQSPMWTASSLGIHNYDTNFFDLVKSGKVRVHLADVTRVEGTTVHLSNGEAIDTDVVVCATGWKKESKLNVLNFDGGLKIDEVEKEKMAAKVDAEITSTYPMLKDQPSLRHAPGPVRKIEPLRNYRFIVPSQSVFKRNIAYAGMVSTVITSTFASVQAQWISTYFDGKLDREAKNEEAVTKEVMLHTQFGKWRYPCGYGASLPDFAFDSLPYIDLLMNDMGLKPHRKSSSMVEMVEPYKPYDYKGLAEEWKTLHGASVKG